MRCSFVTASPHETELIAGALAELVSPGSMVFLKGDLGTGKTVFVRGMVSALGGTGVRSPSFTLINEYDGPVPVAHADFYRLDEADFRDMGLDDYRDDGWIVVAEWPERLRTIPEGRGFFVYFSLMSKDPEHSSCRIIKIDPLTEEDGRSLSSSALNRWENPDE